VRQREQDRRRRRAAQQRAEQLDRRRVGPVEIVENEDERPEPGEVLEQGAHRPVAAVALVLDRDVVAAREREERGEDVRELRAHVLVETLERGRVEPADVLVERVDEDGERQVTLELRRGAGEDEAPSRVSPTGELHEQASLADPGLADELDHARLIEHPECLVERFELFGPPDEMLATQGHFPFRRG
jgi:hypothetical protein